MSGKISFVSSFSQFMSSMVIIRNPIDAATYASIILEPIYNHNLNKIISINPIGGITGYKKHKKWDKRANQIISKGFLSINEINELSKRRNEGNFSAHHFVLKKNLNNILKIYESKHELPEELPKQYTTEKDNQSNLVRAFEVIKKLQYNYLKFYKIIP